MLVVQSTLVGYTLINGTFSIQMALLIASIYNVAYYGDIVSHPYFNDLTQEQKDFMTRVRSFSIPFTHFCMMLINLLTSSTRISLDGVKAASAFIGMIMYVNLLLLITEAMFLFGLQINWTVDPSVAGVYLFFEVEWTVFLGTIVSNMIFLLFRTFIRHKIQLDRIPERKQLPNVDTIISIMEVSNAFGAQLTPLLVSIFIYY